MTTETTPNAEKIAAGLTEAQRRAVAAATFSEQRGAWHPGGWYAAGDKWVRYSLCRMGLAHDYLRRSNRLTPLGEQVREILRREA
jgi:hypothetical protein